MTTVIARAAKHDFGYLQSLSLKDENRLWAATFQ